MRPSTTAPVSSDAAAPAPAPAHGAQAGSPASGRLVALKILLGILGLAGCVLVGAGGAWLVKHFLMADPRPGASAVQAAPMARTPPVSALPSLPASSAAPVVVPALPAQAIAPPSDAPVAAIEQAPPSAGRPAPADATAEAPAEQATPYATTSPVPGKRSRVVDAGDHSASARADKAKCLARVNAITADLSLRNEPPTPEQLAILKRGCK